MNRLIYLSLVAVCLCCSGCFYPSITGKVVDAETGKPIAGAIVFAQWNTTHGFGLSYHKVYKTVETETDAQGIFHIDGVYNPRVNAPTLVIYKDNYVAWRNDYVFPKWEKRKDYRWTNNQSYKLVKMSGELDINKYKMFVESEIMFSDDMKNPPLLFNKLEDMR